MWELAPVLDGSVLTEREIYQDEFWPVAGIWLAAEPYGVFVSG